MDSTRIIGENQYYFGKVRPWIVVIDHMIFTATVIDIV